MDQLLGGLKIAMLKIIQDDGQPAEPTRASQHPHIFELEEQRGSRMDHGSGDIPSDGRHFGKRWKEYYGSKAKRLLHKGSTVMVEEYRIFKSFGRSVGGFSR